MDISHLEWKYDIVYGKKSKVFKSSCLRCGIEVWKQKAQILRCKKHFCSKECQNSDQKNGSVFICTVCNTETYKIASQQRSYTNTYFCSRSCAESYRSIELSESNKARLGALHPNYINGGGTYRERAFRNYGKICENPECPIGTDIPEQMLDVDHIDGNRQNNDKLNLQVLCMWCHGTKTRLGKTINARVIKIYGVNS